MHVFDSKIKQNLGKYLWQCGLATLSILAIMLSLDIILHTAIITSLGATTFIIFAMPKSKSARFRPLIGGYLVGTSTGALCSLLAKPTPWLQGDHLVSSLIAGSIAVGMAIFLMVVTNTEHPPAAGIALSLVLNPWDYYTLLFIVGSIILLALVKKLLGNTLIDLV